LTELDALYVEGIKIERPEDGALVVEWLSNSQLRTSIAGDQCTRVVVGTRGQQYTSVVSNASAEVLRQLGGSKQISEISARLGVDDGAVRETAAFVRGAARAQACALQYKNFRASLADQRLHWWQVNEGGGEWE
jgi:hypothetical protein